MTTQIYGAVDKVSKSGDAMTGTLTLNGSPAAQASAAATGGGLVTVTNTASAPSNATTQLIAAAAGDKLLGLKVSGDTVARLVGDSNGKLSWGPGGSTAPDTTLYRSAAGTLKTDTALTVGTTLTAANGVINAASGTGVAVTGSATGQSLLSTTGADATSNTLAAGVTGDAYDRVRFQVNGQLNIGPGTATRDTTVGRAAAGVLYTPKNLLVGGSAALGDNGVGEVQLANAATAPTTAPTGGVAVFSQGGILKWIDTTGKVYDMSEFISMNLDNTFGPADHGLIAWSCDPATVATYATPASGGVRLVRVGLRRAATITYLWVSVATAGSGLTAGQCFVGLYNSSGTQLGVSADQSSAWTTTGPKQAALTSAYSAAAGTYYIALLANGTTTPAFAASGGVTANANLTVSNGRSLTGPSAQTTLPASITMSSNTFNNIAYWAAVS